MPYKSSSTNIASLSYVGQPSHGEVSSGEREFYMEGKLDFPTLFKN